MIVLVSLAYIILLTEMEKAIPDELLAELKLLYTESMNSDDNELFSGEKTHHIGLG